MFGIVKKNLLEDAIKVREEKINELGKALNDMKIKYAELEDKLRKKFNDEKALAFKTMELEFKDREMTKIQAIKDEYQEKTTRGIEENFSKLKDSLSKLHEDGNANTKFQEKMSLTLMEQFGKTAKALNGPSK